jgi:hypothetical protein
MAVGDPSTGYLYKTTISDLKTLTGAGVISFNGRFGAVSPAEGDYTLNQLGDVIITSATNGNILQYNGSNWVNANIDLSGYVPYTGATANVNLGTFDLTADVITGATGSFASSGGSNTFSINHSSGSGIALSITKGGNGEGIYVNKTGGSGNAATIVGILEATTLVKTGGTSSQFLKADGSVDSSTYLTTSAAASTYVPLTRTLTINGTTYDLTENRSWTITAGISSVSGTSPISVDTVSGAATVSISQANSTTNGYLSSTDWATFNSKQNAITLTTTGSSGSATLVGATLNIPTYTLAGLGGQPALNGTGFVKISGTTISYDNSTYLTTSSASSTYLPLTGGTLTGALNISNDRVATLVPFKVDNNLGYGIYISADNALNFNYGRNETSTGYINFRGYNDGSTQFRNLVIADGKNATIAEFTASSKLTTLYGALSGTSATFSSSVIATAPSNAVALQLNGRSSDNIGQILFYANNGTTLYNYIQSRPTYFAINTETNTPIYFGTNMGGGGDTRMTILGNGNVGIGTSSPTGKFHVVLPTYTNEDTDSQQAIFGASNGYGVRIGYTESGNYGVINSLKPGVAWGRIVLQSGGGQVYINTTSGVSGGGALQVNGDVNINGNFKINGTTIGGGGGSGVTGAGTNGYLTKWTGSTTLGNGVMFDNGTSVGVNMTSPLKMFHVYAGNADGIATGRNLTNDNMSANIFLYPSATTTKKNWAISAYFTRQTALQFLYSSTSTSDPYGTGTPIITFEGANGNVLIGTTTDLGGGYKLQVNGSISMAYASFFNFKGSSGAGDVLVDNSGSALRITGNTTVSGSVTASSFFESSDIRFKNVLEYNPSVNVSGIDVIKFTRHSDSKIRYGYSAQQVQSIFPDAVMGENELVVNYIDIHTLKIAQLEKEVAELKAKLN